MKTDATGNFTLLLERHRQGEAAVRDQLMTAIYSEQRRLASYDMSNERAGHTFQHDDHGLSYDVQHQRARLNGPMKCTIRAYDDQFLTAVYSGGLAIPDALHTDAARVGNWEKFKVSCRPL